jgi:hypothetical protein
MIITHPKDPAFLAQRVIPSQYPPQYLSLFMVYRFLMPLRVTVLFVVPLVPLLGAEDGAADGSGVVVVVGVSVPVDVPVAVVVGASVAVEEGGVGVVVGAVVVGDEFGGVLTTSWGVAPGVVVTGVKVPQPLTALVSRLMVLVPLPPQEE